MSSGLLDGSKENQSQTNSAQHLEFCQQVLWPELDVQTVSVTEQWAQYAVAGPNARKVIEALLDPGQDISNEAFLYMAAGAFAVCGGANARLFRLSFSGELAYEIAVPAQYGDALIRAIVEADARRNLLPALCRSGRRASPCLSSLHALRLMDWPRLAAMAMRMAPLA